MRFWNIPLGDIDIATTALPDEVVRRARAAGIKCVPTGIDHGTVTLVVESHPFEVTTLREDTETFGRKAKVAFGRDWVRDAERRDFTINGLSVDADGIVHDHVGGLADIEAKRVRFIGDASQRIAEDYLRILRFFRIHAAYGAGEPDRAGYLACIDGRAGFSSLPPNVRMEMLKLLIAEGATVAVQAMADAGLLLPIFGGVTYTGAFAAMIAVERALGCRRTPCAGSPRSRSPSPRTPNASRRGFGFPTRKPRRWTRWAIAGGGSPARTTRGTATALSARRGSYRDRLMLAWARAGGIRQWRRALARPRHCRSAGARRNFR